MHVPAKHVRAEPTQNQTTDELPRVVWGLPQVHKTWLSKEMYLEVLRMQYINVNLIWYGEGEEEGEESMKLNEEQGKEGSEEAYFDFIALQQMQT